MNRLNVGYYVSPVGTFRLTADDHCLKEMVLTDQVGKSDANRIINYYTEVLDQYFQGDNPDIYPYFDFDAHSPFYKKVWKALLEIPYGRTISYKELAVRIHQPTAIRAVALANAKNPFPILVPCHRVIGSDGSLTGYALGIPMKRRLLMMEGAIPQDLFSPL